MADGNIGIDEPGTIDKRVDTEELTVAATTVQRERMQIAGATDVGIAIVVNADPGSTDYALVVRDIGPSSHARNDAFANAQAMGGELDDTAPVVATEGNVSPLRITANRAGHVMLRGAGANALDLGTGARSADTLRVTVATDDLVPISAASLPLPAGAATAALQLADGHNVTADAGTGDFLTIVGHTINEALKEAAAVGGQFDDAATTAATEDNIAPVRITAQRALHATLRGVGANPLDLNTGVRSADTLRVTVATNDLVPISAASLPLPAGAATAALQLADDHNVTVSNANLEVVGDVAHDAAAAGNPVLLGGVARTTEPAVVSTAADLAQLMTDMVGKLVVLPYCTPDQMVNAQITKTTAAIEDVLAAAGAGVRNYVTSFSASNTSATGVRIDFSDGATIFGSYFLAASGGGVSHIMPVPIRGTANTAVRATLSAAVTDVRISVQGYKSAA
jgi:hypothetical protein